MTEKNSTVSVAVLGTGLIGAAIARNLARKGFHVRGWNRTAEKAQALIADGSDRTSPHRRARPTSPMVSFACFSFLWCFGGVRL